MEVKINVVHSSRIGIGFKPGPVSSSGTVCLNVWIHVSMCLCKQYLFIIMLLHLC